MSTGGWRERARDLQRETLVLALAASDSRVPWYGRALVVLAVAYALSPLDLIPDFIPVIGYLDDALIVPAAVLVARRMIPEAVMAEHRTAIDAGDPRVRRLRRFGVVLVVGMWASLAAVVVAAILFV